MRFWSYLTSSKKCQVFIFIAFSIILLRLPTLFVDYYEIDVLTSFVVTQKKMAGEPYAINKGPVYHAVLESSYKLFGETPSSFHLMGIILILLTASFIYLLTKKAHSHKAGVLAAFLYGVYISAFNRNFMSINAEIVYNLFFMGTFYFVYLFEFHKKYWASLPALIFCILAIKTKFQGLWVLLALIVFYFIVKPMYAIQSKKVKKNYFYALCGFIVAVIVLFFIDFNVTGLIVKGALKRSFEGFYNYVAVKGFNPIFFIAKLSHRVVMLLLYHSLAWIFAFITVKNFFKSKAKQLKTAYFVYIGLFLLISVCFGGVRLYFHYFVHAYPFLCILASFSLIEYVEKIKWKRALTLLFFIPVGFVFLWNVKDAYIVNYKPQWFYNEGKALYYFRMAFLAQKNDYLLPHKTYLKALSYLKESKELQSKTMFVWPEGAEFAFFSNIKSVNDNYWHNVGALACNRQKDLNKITCEEHYADKIIYSKADLFIDLSYSPRSDLYKLGGTEKMFPKLMKRLKTRFFLLKDFKTVKIWRRKDKKF